MRLTCWSSNVRIHQRKKEGGTYSPREAEIIETKCKLDQLIAVADLELKQEKLNRLVSRMLRFNLSVNLPNTTHMFLSAEAGCTQYDFRHDLAVPDKVLNLSQQDKNLFAAANLLCAPVSTKSSSVVEFMQKIEAAALRNNTASLWLYSFPSVLCRSHPLL